MVHTMVLPVLTMLRTVLMTMAAALASSPEYSIRSVGFEVVSNWGR